MKIVRIRYVYFCLSIITPFIVNAQSDSFKPIKDISSFQKTFTEHSGKIHSIQSTFRQEKTLSLLAEKMISDGKFWFKRSNRIRIEYQKPFQYLLILNNDDVLMKDNDKENRVNVRSNKLFQEINQIILDCVQGTILDNKDFSVAAFESVAGYRLVMKPETKGLQIFFTEIVIFVEKKDFSVSQLGMYEPGGDFTIIYFLNKELNTHVPDSVFDLAK